MAAPGMLTRSGMLYEGNWIEWEDRCYTRLEMLKTGFGKAFRGPADGPRPVVRMRARDPTATSICEHVSPALLARVPMHARDTPQELVSRLRALARPFRLNDLPPELRARIFRFHFGPVTRYNIGAGSVKDETKQPLSNLLIVSRATRTEALPLFLGSAEICFQDPLFSFHRGGNFIIETNIREWIQTSIKENTKYLRSIKVREYFTIRGWEVVVRLDRKKGLKLGPTPKMSPEERGVWKDHVKKIEAIRQTLGLQGEAVVLALTTKSTP
ncbi:hypothetical protein LTS10_002443 [Elasticomyces elasticus]|nr:hypothetical protein LTS10_002443 [Elasticomyces elasticus]